MSGDLLAVEGVETCYGQSQVLFGMSFRVEPGEMVILRQILQSFRHLRHIVSAARELVQARYGALGAVGHDGV